MPICPKCHDNDRAAHKGATYCAPCMAKYMADRRAKVKETQVVTKRIRNDSETSGVVLTNG